MKKQIKKSFIFSLLLLFFHIYSVNAECGVDISCTYEKSTGERINTVVNINNTTNPPTLTSSTQQSYYYGNYYGSVDYANTIDFWVEDEEYYTVEEWMGDNECSCPTYLHAYSESTGSSPIPFVYFSNKPADKLSPKPSSTFTISEDSKIDNVTEDGTVEYVAQKYACEYKSELLDTVLTINQTDKKIYASSGQFIYLEDYQKTFDFTSGECPTDLYACEYESYTDDLVNDIYSYNDLFVEEDAYVVNVSTDCVPLMKTDNEIFAGTNGCLWYFNNVKIYKDAVKSGDVVLEKNSRERIRTFCNNVKMYLDYDNYKYSCIYLCIKSNEDLKPIDFSPGTCGLSQKMIIWIANIIRWVKYIVPVVAIVLGILDFMKAISGDKEDEMKKAQQRFIRRLIAAALIFIIPFIIEFILVKFGFDSNGCGIINL